MDPDWPKEYVTSLTGGLSDLYTDESFTDVTIEVGGKHFKCHKVILSSFSSYFKAMFTSQMKESTENAVSLPFIDQSTFELVLDFIYRGKNIVTSDMATTLLKAANFMQIDLLQKKCAEKLTKNLTTENCLDVWNLAKTLNCHILEERVFTFVLKKFPQLIENGLLLELDLDDIAAILDDGRVTLPVEDTVTDFILYWLKKYPERKFSSVADACKLLRLPFTSPEYLFQFFATEHQDLLNEVEIVNLLEEAKNYQGMPARQAMFSSNSTSLRNASHFDDVIMVIGGVKPNEEFCKDVFAYSLGRCQWFTLSSLPCYKGKFASACSYGKSDVYIYGGHVNSKKTLKYNGITNTWIYLKDAPVGIVQASAMTIGKCLYSFGGTSNNHKATSTILKYSISIDRWIHAGNLVHAVVGVSTAVCKGKILIVGGMKEGNNNSFVASHSVQCFDPRTNDTSVINVCTQELGKGFQGCCGFDNDIILVNSHRNIYHYNSDRESFEELGQVVQPPGAVYGTARRNNIVYILGGYKGNEQTVSDMVTYDIDSKKSTPIDLPFLNVKFPCLKLVVNKEHMKKFTRY